MDVGAFAAFVAGLLSFLSPCVLPLVPPYLCFLAGVSLEDLTSGRQQAVSSLVITRAVSFVLGFATVFVALGASASYLGQLVSEHLTLLSRVAGVIVLILGLHMLGVFRLLSLSREARVHVERRPTTAIGAYVVGLAFAFGWSPCVGPVLASILLIAGSDDSVSEGAALLASYAAGIGVPFLLAAAFTGPFLRWMARFRHHLGAVEKTMGLALVATGVLIFMGAMPILAGWLLEALPVLGRIG